VKDENTLKLCAIYLHCHAQPLDQYRRCVHDHIVLKSCFDLCYASDECRLRMFSSGHLPERVASSSSSSSSGSGTCLSLANSLTDIHNPANAHHHQPAAKKKKPASHLNPFASHLGEDFLSATRHASTDATWTAEEAELYRAACVGGWQALSLEEVAGDVAKADVESLVPPTRENPVRILFDASPDGANGAKDRQRECDRRRHEALKTRMFGPFSSPHLMDEFRSTIERLERTEPQDPNCLARRLFEQDMRMYASLPFFLLSLFFLSFFFLVSRALLTCSEPKKEFLSNRLSDKADGMDVETELPTDNANETNISSAMETREVNSELLCNIADASQPAEGSLVSDADEQQQQQQQNQNAREEKQCVNDSQNHRDCAEPSPRLPAFAASWQDLFVQLQRQPSSDSNGQISAFFLKR
jgi:hypothetical protein